nr:glycosyltransferase [Selenomonas ruminantium]
MSTYNGEKYIYEQIDSIMKQNIKHLILLIRDDGSQDKTVEIIDSLKKNLPPNREIRLIRGHNIGAECSFYELIYYAKKNLDTCKYYAFSDQDDVWERDKIPVAVKLLSKMNDKMPNLYYSNLKVVDEKLNFIGYKFKKGYVKTTSEFVATEMCAWGCTCVFNFKALDEMSKIKYDYYLAHDNWILWLCTFKGRCIYDEKSYILYRQHGDNVSGQVKFGLEKIWQNIKKMTSLLKLRAEFEPRAKLLLSLYDDNLNIYDKDILRQVAFYKDSFRSRIMLLCSTKISSGHLLKEIGRRVRIILGEL